MIVQERSVCGTCGGWQKRSGTVWRTTSCSFFCSFSFPIPDPPVQFSQAMIDEFDLDQDGEINEQEFFAIMTDDA